MGTSYYDPFYSAYQAQLSQMQAARRDIAAYTRVEALEKKQREKMKKLKLLL